MLQKINKQTNKQISKQPNKQTNKQTNKHLSPSKKKQKTHPGFLLLGFVGSTDAGLARLWCHVRRCCLETSQVKRLVTVGLVACLFDNWLVGWMVCLVCFGWLVGCWLLCLRSSAFELANKQTKKTEKNKNILHG